jgi:predicted kinase
MLNGASCTGKSTVISKVMDKKNRLYHLSYDAQRWFFAKYHRKTHATHVENIVLILADAVCRMGYDIICDAGIHKEYREKLLHIPKKYKYEVIEVNLEADYDLIVERFHKKLAFSLLNPEIKISNTSKKRLKELYDAYHAEKNLDAKTFRIDRKNVDEIVESISKMI